MASYQKKGKKRDPSYTRKKSNYYPIVRKMECKPPAGPYVAVNSSINVDHVLSRANKRLYRQHMVYRAKVSINTNGIQAPVNVYALAPTWYVLNAIRKAKETHDEAMADEMEQMGKSRWHDFRIFTGLSTTELLDDFGIGGGAGGTTGYTPEYRESIIQCADGNQRVFRLTGATSTSQYNVIDEYDKFGNTNEDAASAPGGYDQAVAEIDDFNVATLQIRGDQPPYRDDMSNIFVKVGEIYRDANGNQSMTTGYFDAPLGLIYLQGLDPNVHADGVLLEVAAGKYKGVDSIAL